MIRFKDGKVDKNDLRQSYPYPSQAAYKLADALDVAVVALRNITNAPGTKGYAMQSAIAALRQIGADHAER